MYTIKAFYLNKLLGIKRVYSLNRAINVCRYISGSIEREHVFKGQFKRYGFKVIVTKEQ